MAATFVSEVDGGEVNAATNSWSHYVTGSSLVLAVVVACDNDAVANPVVTYGSITGTADPNSPQSDGDDGTVFAFYIPNPTIGNNTVAVTFPVVQNFWGFSVLVEGANTTTPRDTSASGSDPAAGNPSTNITPSANSILIDIMKSEQNSVLTKGADQTYGFTQDAGTWVCGYTYREITTSQQYTMSWSGGDDSWCHIVIAIAESGAAPQSVVLDELTLAGSSESLGDVTPGAVSQLLDALTLASSSQFLYIPRSVTLSSLYLWSLLGSHYLLFTGESSSKVNCGKGGNIDNIPDGRAFTIDTWVRYDTSPSYQTRTIVDKFLTNSYGGFELISHSVDEANTGLLIGRVGSTGGYARSELPYGTLVENEWQHITMFYDYNGDRKVYLAVDGNWADSYNYQLSGSSIIYDDGGLDFIIGGDNSISRGWNGGIGYVRISEGDRFSHEIDFTPPARGELPPIDANTMFQWNFYDKAGATLTEFVEAKNGTIANATWHVDGLSINSIVSTLLDELTLVSSLESIDISVGNVYILLSALNLLSSAEDININTGIVSVLLNTLTLLSSPEDLVVFAGNVNLLMNALTLASSLESLGISASVSVLLDVLTLVSSVESISVSEAISVILNSLTLLGSAEGITISVGAVSQLLNELTLASSAEGLILSPGSISTLVNALVLASSLESLTVSAGEAQILLDALTLLSTLEDVTISSTVNVLMDVLTLASSLESITIGEGVLSIVLATLTLAGTTESLSVTAGAISQLLNELTLSSSLESLNITVGGVSTLMDVLTLASSLESSTVSSSVQLLLDELTLVSSVENITLSPGSINLLVNSLSLVSSLESMSVFAGLQVLLVALTLASSLESLTLSPGFVSNTMDALTLTSALQALTVSPGEITMSLDELSLSSSLESLFVTPGVATTILSSLILEGAVESITIDEGVLSVVLNTLSLASSLEGSTVTPGEVSIVLDDLVLSGNAESLAIVPGGISLLVDTLTLTSSSEPITIDISYRITLQTLSLASSPEDISFSTGEISIPVNTLTLSSSAEDILISIIESVLAGRVDVSDALINDIIASDRLAHIIHILDGEN